MSTRAVRIGAGPVGDRLITLSFTLLSVALAFWQKPGWATSDTKIDLHVDPSRFLHSVASVWTPSTDLGEVHSAQYSGYLWPMGPFFSVLHSLGLSPWVVQRLWLGLMYGLAVWGLLKLLDALVGRPRRTVHLVAAAFYLFNPYVVVFTARTTITLLGYAALPWLLLVTFHGVRAVRGWRGWRGWWWAAAFALILTSSGGGVNAAVVGWMLVGPLVLLLYEAAVGVLRWRDAGGFLARIGLLSVAASLWWIVPLLVHVRYGIDFLQFTEQPASIWGTNSATESLRLMGYWTSYIGVGFGTNRPFFSDAATLLFNPVVVGASLLLPALAVAGFVRARRVSYAPFLLLMAVVGLVIMIAGFPDGTPVRHGMDWIYHNVLVLRFMRTTNKAAPLVAAGFAGLLGLGAQRGRAWLALRPATPGWRVAGVLAPVSFLVLLALASLPLVRGGALDTQLLWKRIPPAWTQAGHGLDRELPPNTRTLVTPGQIFAYYNWGGTIDAILPRLTDRPVAVRYETPYADLHAVDLLTTVDDLVQQRRLLPGELGPLLRLMGVGAVITGADDDISRSGAIDPAAAAGVLAGQGLGTPSRAYGPVSRLPPAKGDLDGAVALPEVRRYDIASPRGIVHVDPVTRPTILDGGATSLADLAAFGALPGSAPLLFAGDQGQRTIQSAAGTGADLVVGDSDRRRVFLPESTEQNRGPVLRSDDAVRDTEAVINPFPSAGTDAQTVAVLKGASYLTAPTAPGQLQFPEHGPIAALDGDPATAWIADRYLPVSRRYIEVGFSSPRDVPYVDLLPLSDAHGVVSEVDVNGVRHAVGRGWTRIALGLHAVRALRVTIDHVVEPRHGLGGPGGMREIRVPGLHVSQSLRAPIVLGRALAGRNLEHDSLTYLFERSTGDQPFRRNPYGTLTALNDPQDRGDPEAQIDRVVFAPAPRSYRMDAWVYPALGSPDPELDRLAGLRGPVSFASSSRFQDQPRFRASSAFGSQPGPGWVGFWDGAEAPAPWIGWTTPRPLALRGLRLLPSTLPVRRPTLVQLSWPGGQTPALPVAADGQVVLPQAARAQAFRLTVLQAALPAGATARQSRVKAVAIGRLSVPGLAPVSTPAPGALHSTCGLAAITVGGRAVPLAPQGTLADLDAGRPLRARPCGAPGRASATVAMGAGIQEIRSLPAPFSVDLLRLSSPAPMPVRGAAAGGSVLDPGQVGNSSVSGVRVSLRSPSWLVLGQSFDRGWQATCDGRSLGAPQVVDAYANGWPAPAGCNHVTFTFGPQGGAQSAYVVSAVICLLLLLFVLLGALRRPAAASVRVRARAFVEVGLHPRTLPRAAALALLAAIPLGALFAIRAGIVSFPILTFVLWRGYGPRTLALTAVGLIGLAVPVIYLITSPDNRGGYNFTYGTQLIYAHWVGVTAIVLLALVLLKLLRPRTRR